MKLFTVIIKCLLLCFLFFPFRNSELCAQNQTQAFFQKNVKVDSLPSIPFLPDPLISNEGTLNKPITQMRQWRVQRKWIMEQYQYWISGTRPPAPNNFATKVLSERKESGVLIRMVELHFGPEQEAKLTIELMIPPSSKKLPVFITQWNHRGWAQIAVRRGYIGCVYAAADAKDDTPNYSLLYPQYSFATLMKRAWAASRAIDYLYTLNYVDTACIGLTGHSRNAKQSLMAAAFDERIKAIVSSSGGTGGENPFRYTDDPYDNESIDDITTNFPDWFHSRLRLYIGKENKLPVDQNSLMALVAPRGLLLSTALNETEGGPWGIEQAFKSAKRVFQFCHAENNLGILYRNGSHGTSARDIERYIDFFDYIFGRSETAPENKLYYDYSFTKWESSHNEHINAMDFPINKDDQEKISASQIPLWQVQTRKKIEWLLGKEPPGISANDKITVANSKQVDDFIAGIIHQAHPGDDVKKLIIGPYNGAGEYLWADLYYSGEFDLQKDPFFHKLPLVIFLHEYAHTTGYRRRCENMINTFTRNGFAVLAFDMIGYGTRIEEFKNFYSRYPDWSIMGKMVADTRLLISDVYSRMAFIDTTNVFLVGYSLGGTVASLTSALDLRVKGTAVVCAFDSWRTNDDRTEGIKHFSHLHGLIPRLGIFVHHESRIPIDFNEIMSAISPRPLLVIAPSGDRYHPTDEVKHMASYTAKIYKRFKIPGHFSLLQPDTYNHFTEKMLLEITNWMKNVSTEN